MKKFLCMVMPMLVASVVSLSSCTKNGEETPGNYFFYENFSVQTGELEMRLYDLSVTYYKFSQGNMVTWTMPLGYFEYFGGEFMTSLPDGFEFKVVGTLKPNAREIVDELVKAGKPMTFGEKYDCVIAFYKDRDRTAAHKILMKSTNDRINTMNPENFSIYLDRPTITIVKYDKK